MIGYCCGCGKQAEIGAWEKRGEPDRYTMRKCSCGSKTGALVRFQRHRKPIFVRPDKTRRRDFTLLRNLKRVEVPCE